VSKSLLVLALLVAGLSACNPYLYQASAPPPGRSARLDPVNGFWAVKRYRLELSTGIAVALNCEHGGPCEHMKIVSDNPAIAEVRIASLSSLTSIPFTYQQQPQSAFVVVGKAPGSTTLHVLVKDKKRDVTVTVIAPPGPANAQTAALTAPSETAAN
jgi:hypothetical protein